MDKLRRFLLRYKFNSLMFNNFLKFFLVQLVVFLIISVGLLFFVLNNFKNEVVVSNKNLALRVEDISKTIFSQIDSVASNLYIDSDVKNYIIMKDEILKNADVARLMEKLIYYKNIVKYIDSIYIYSSERNMFCTTNGEMHYDNFNDAEFVNKIVESLSADTAVFQRKIAGKYPEVLTMVKNVNNIGYVVVNLDYNKYKSELETLFEDNSNIYILSSDDKIVFADNNIFADYNVLKKIIYGQNGTIYNNNGQKLVCSTVSVGYFNQRLLVTTDFSEYNNKIGDIIKIIFETLAVFILVSVLVAVFSAFSSFGIIMKLYDVVDDKNIDISGLSDNEGKYIVTKVISIIDDNKYLKEQLEKRLSDYNKAQITALQNQINPHFLNNVLSAISLEIVDECSCDSGALAMIVKLTRIIEYSFANDIILVDFSDELNFIYNYVDLLCQRFGNFKFRVNIADQVMRQKILRLSIQPLIENAVYHGIYAIKEKGIVTLSADIIDDMLIITVEDNGVGIGVEMLDKINNIFGEDATEHIGLNNVYKRLKIIYGDKADLKCESDGSSYTKVYMIIPV